jgi:Aldo/keto reductases, related to diketogulonate reductase
MTVPAIALNNGTAIPQLGLGTASLDDEQIEPVIVTAVELGYRHFDTAAKYGNEIGVGRGIRASGLPREQLFITTKLDGPYQGDDRAIAGLDACLDRLGLDYVDLLLMHWPLPQRGLFVDTWRTFEKLAESGKARAIGVSNFQPAHLRTLSAQTSVVPAVNQIQLSPQHPRLDHREYDARHGIVTESWSPLGGGGSGLLEDAIIARLARSHGRTPAQIVLRWHVQNGLVAIPRSHAAERLRQNLDVFDFELDEQEMLALARLDGTAGPGVDSDVTGH